MEQQILSECSSESKEAEHRSAESYQQREAEEIATEAISSEQNAFENRGVQDAQQESLAAQQSVEASRRVEELLSTLRVEAAGRKRKRRGITISVSAYFLLMGTAAIAQWRSGAHFPSIFGSFGSMTGLIGAFAAVTQKHKEATKQLAQFNDMRAIGPLAEALDFADADTRRVAEEALTRLLPNIRASDAALLTAEQTSALIRALNRPHPELSIAILQALTQIGDEKALPAVEKLAHGEGDARLSPALKQAAQDCLPTLITRMENRRAGAELLRAANGNETPAEMLLRPAAGSPVTEDGTQLLRVPEMPLQQISNSREETTLSKT